MDGDTGGFLSQHGVTFLDDDLSHREQPYNKW